MQLRESKKKISKEKKLRVSGDGKSDRACEKKSTTEKEALLSEKWNC